MIRKTDKTQGFTIVELIIIIIVITIIATITIVSYKGVQEQTQAVAIANAFKTIDEAIVSYSVKSGATQWWDDETLKDPVDGESSIDFMVRTTGLGDYLDVVPIIPGFPTDFFTYDNDLDTYSGCQAYSYGVNIQTPFTNTAVAMRVDKLMDDGNLSCGKVRIDQSGELVYLLSKTSAF